MRLCGHQRVIIAIKKQFSTFLGHEKVRSKSIYHHSDNIICEVRVYMLDMYLFVRIRIKLHNIFVN